MREDNIWNEFVKGSIGVASIVDNMREDRLRRVGHVMRRVKSEAVRMTMEMNVKESRGR